MYFDPGFGSMIIQVLIAGVAACGAMLIVFKKRIKDFFAKRKKTEDGKKH